MNVLAKLNRSSFWLSRGWGCLALALVTSLGLVASLFLFTVLRLREQDRVERDLAEAAGDRISLIQQNIEHCLFLLESVATFYHSSEQVSRDEFQTFVRPLRDRECGIPLPTTVGRGPAKPVDGRRESPSTVRRPPSRRRVRGVKDCGRGEWAAHGQGGI